ncbi:SIR2 family protein [Bifidobacterium sp. ESL0784]|uniref:SIR2 family protein n=1 Tax=Bifidobacterium sp. ESL0784 TaxID=2983231 RepID=UPI0023F9B758|nr:SIR2 family protein [Bifidobacterium sp. ESL0784]MDF7641088.1 SIR2 family protein [Bifidobacterium sp. ESL0784]
MQITKGVNVPDEVLDALDDNKLVFFVGAGASRSDPSNLPLFKGLADRLAEEAGVPGPEENDPCHNEALDSFIGNLPRNFDQQYHTRNFFANAGAKPNRTHRAIVRLAATNKHELKIVTTNYDTLLEQASIDAQQTPPHVYTAPALPSGKSFKGIVHIHGKYDDQDSPLVLSDRDFASAYLSEAWATRFLLDMFKNYTVLFIGYSHDDTLMQYLAMGLPSETKRYVLCPKIKKAKEKQKWEHLKIIPVEYPVHNGDFSELPEALEHWYQDISSNRAGRKARLQEIMNHTTLSKTDNDYLIKQLHTVDGVKVFADIAQSSLEWLRWILSVPDFRELFEGKEPDKDKKYEGKILSWFITYFVSNSDSADVALSLLNGKPLSDTLFYELCRASIFSISEHPQKTDKIATYLMTSVPRQTLINWPDPDMFAYGYSSTGMPLTLLSASLRPFISKQSGTISWQIKPDAIKKQLKLIKKDKSYNKYQLFIILENSLLEAYNLAHSQNGDSLFIDNVIGFQRPRIEASEEDRDHYPTVPDAIIDALRSLGQSYSNSNELINHWMKMSYPVFIRLAIDLENHSQNIPPDTKIQWLNSNNLLYNNPAKHETFCLLRDNLYLASQTTKNTILAKALDGPYDKAFLDKRSFEYDKYNLLVWLCDSVPNWNEAEKERDRIAKQEKFAPREHPDLDFVISSGMVDFADENPLTDDKFIFEAKENPKSLVTLLASLPTHREHPFAPGGTFDGGTEQLTRLSVSNTDVSLNILEAVKADNTINNDKSSLIIAAIIKGWENSTNTVLTKVVSALEPCVTNSKLALPIARFIEAKTRSSSNDIENFQNLSKLATRLWDCQASEYTAINLTMNPSMSTVNEWPGIITKYWIDYALKTPKTKKFEEKFVTLLNTDFPTYQTVAGTFAYRMFNLFEMYPEFVAKQIFPLFSKSDTDYWCWNSYLLNSRQIDAKIIDAGFDKELLYGMQNCEKWGTPDDGTLRILELLVFETLSVSQNLALPIKQKLMSSIIIYGNPLEFAKVTIFHELSQCNEKIIKQIWSSWLHEYFQNRCNGLPRDNSPEEINWLCRDLFYLNTDDLNKAIKEFENITPYLTEDIMFSLDKIDRADSSKLKLFERMLKNSHPDTPFANYALQELFEKLAKVLEAEKMQYLYAMAYENGFDLKSPED